MSEIKLTWWNLQNFFDTTDDPIANDFAYTAAEGWTPAVFAAKRDNLAAALMATHAGEGPDLLAVCEIEHDALLQQLLDTMGRPGMKVVTDPSGTRDLRGIDVAMAYDSRKLKVVAKASHLVHLRYRTRDLFEVTFEVKATGEPFTLIASHWPSRRLGRYRSEPLRIAVAEHIAYLVESHLKFEPEQYLALREAGDITPVQQRWDNRVMVVGDFNDEPCDRSVVDHLKAGHDLDRVTGETNDIDGFHKAVSRYRAEEVFLYNACWRFLGEDGVGSFYIAGTRSGDQFANRYQMLDQLVVSRGFLLDQGLTLDRASVAVFADPLVATGSQRPRAFSKHKQTGTSDHLPLTAVLRY